MNYFRILEIVLHIYFRFQLYNETFERPSQAQCPQMAFIFLEFEKNLI